MTNAEKQLLLKDLTARLPYGVICLISNRSASITEELKIGGLEAFEVGSLEVKPYLRPMSSMTEDEENELVKTAVVGGYNDDSVFNSYIITDWLNEHHFDYRGLIPMGLALEAKEEMYKTK